MSREPRSWPDADGARDRTVRLLAAFAALGRLDQPGAEEHLDVEVEMARVDVEPLRELAVRQRLAAFAAEHLEHAKPERMTERLELLGALDREDVAAARLGGSQGHAKTTYRISAAVVKPGGSGAVENHRGCAILGAKEARRRCRASDGPAKACATASALLSPTTRNTTRAAAEDGQGHRHPLDVVAGRRRAPFTLVERRRTREE